MGLDFEAQDQIGSGAAGLGLVELVAEAAMAWGSPGCGERVEADEQFAVAGDDVTGGGEGFADERAGLVFGAGVLAGLRWAKLPRRGIAGRAFLKLLAGQRLT